MELQLRLLDLPVAREIRLVAADILDEALGGLAAKEDVDRVAERPVSESVSSTAA